MTLVWEDLSCGLVDDSSVFMSRGAVGFLVAFSHFVSSDMLLRHPLYVNGQVSLNRFAGAFSVSLAVTFRGPVHLAMGLRSG